jgi:hypothetical protein
MRLRLLHLLRLQGAASYLLPLGQRHCGCMSAAHHQLAQKQRHQVRPRVRWRAPARCCCCCCSACACHRACSRWSRACIAGVRLGCRLGWCTWAWVVAGSASMLPSMLLPLTAALLIDAAPAAAAAVVARVRFPLATTAAAAASKSSKRTACSTSRSFFLRSADWSCFVRLTSGGGQLIRCIRADEPQVQQPLKLITRH